MQGAVPVLVVASLLASVSAQVPFGRATPVAGTRPVLTAEPLWFGNSAFAVRVAEAPPGGLAFAALSTQRVDVVAPPLTWYPSLAAAHFLVGFVGVVGAAGEVSFASPFAVPPSPGLTGFDVCAQAFVGDAQLGSFGASQGLWLEASLHPLLAMATFAAAGSRVDLLDPVLATVQSVALPPNCVPGEAVFANGGRDLFLATNLGVVLIDTTATPMAATVLLPGAFTGVCWDPLRTRLFANHPNAGIVHVLDGDRQSATFGASVAAVPRFGNWMRLTAAGAELVLARYTGGVDRIDVDPASATWLQPKPMPASPVPFGLGIGAAGLVAMPDGSELAVLVQNLFTSTSSLWRFDCVANQWLDEDPATPGVQPLSAATRPGLPGSFAVPLFDRSGADQWFVGATVARLRHSLGASACSVVPTPVTVPTPTTPAESASYTCVSPTGRFLVEVRSGGSALEVRVVEVATGIALPWAALPPGNDAVCAWR